jgi:hypothetical protein
MCVFLEVHNNIENKISHHSSLLCLSVQDSFEHISDTENCNVKTGSSETSAVQIFGYYSHLCPCYINLNFKS